MIIPFLVGFIGFILSMPIVSFVVALLSSTLSIALGFRYHFIPPQIIRTNISDFTIHKIKFKSPINGQLEKFCSFLAAIRNVDAIKIAIKKQKDADMVDFFIFLRKK